MKFIGRSHVSWDLRDEHQETAWWIGKPWRRFEVLRHRFNYQGEHVSDEWTYSLTLAVPRWGWHFHVSVVRGSYYGYEEEEHQ